MDVARNYSAAERGVAIIDDRIPPSLRRYLGELQRTWNSADDQSRRRATVERLRVYGGDAAWMIRPMPFESPAHFALKVKFTPPLMRLAVKQLSYLYDDPPIRSVTGAAATKGEDGEEDQPGDPAAIAAEEVWRRRVWDYGRGLSSALGRADPLVRLTGTVHVVSLYSPERGYARALSRWMDGGPEPSPPPDAWGLERVRYTPDQVAVVKNPFDAEFADAIALRQAVWDDPATLVAGIVKRQLFHVWTPDYFCAVEGSDLGSWRVVLSPGRYGEPADYVHPNLYGRIPVEVWREERGEDEYWGQPWGGKDLLDNLRTIYEVGTEYLHTSRLQRGQLVYKGASAPVGGQAPDSILKVAPNEDLVALAAAGDLEGMRDALVTSLELLAKSLGLPSRTFRLDDRASQSGVAILLDRLELSDDRKSRSQEALDVERRLAELDSRVIEVHQPGVKLDPELVDVDFGRGATDPQAFAHVPVLADRGVPMQVVDQVLGLGLPEYPGWEIGYVSGSMQPVEDVLGASQAETLVDDMDEPQDEAPEAAEPAAGEVVAEEGSVQDEAYNGIQTSTLSDLVVQVKDGVLPPTAAKVIIRNAYPLISEADIATMVDDAVTFGEAARKAQPPPAPSAPPPTVTEAEGDGAA